MADVDGWTELKAVQLTGSAWGIVAFVSSDEKGGRGVAGLLGGWMELEAVRITGSAEGLVAFISLVEGGGGVADLVGGWMELEAV